MKWILIFTTFFSYSAFANNQVDFSFDHSPLVIEKLLTPIWKEIPYQHTWKNRARKSDKTISAEIVNAKLNLGKKGEPLVDVVPIASNLVDLKWRLQNIQIDGNVRVRFSYKKFGIKISHTENFNLKGYNVANAKSRVNLNFDKNKIKLGIEFNKGFKLERINVAPKNGVGKTLRWIFDNVFSKDDVDRYIRDQVNKEIASYANSKELISDIEKEVNKKFKEFQENKISLGDLSTNMIVKIIDFSLDEKSIGLSGSVAFDNEDRKVHVCASELMQDLIKRRERKQQQELGKVSVTHPLIEQGLINFSAYEMFDDQGNLLEPLFCIGYKEFDKDGNAKGESADINLGIGSIKFNYWVKPFNAPDFIYHVDNNEILVGMKFGVDLKTLGLPRARVKNGPLVAGVLVGFSPKFVSGKGLVLEFNGLEITEISGGDLQVQWVPLLPYSTIDVTRYEQRLESLLNKEIRESLDNDQLVVIDENIDVTDELKVELRGHELTKALHLVEFDLIAK